MASGAGTILELRLEPGGLSGKISCPAGLYPAPGQYLVASSLDPCDPLPTVLFPSAMKTLTSRPGPLVLPVAPPLPSSWSAGLEISLRGPLGHGFHLPATASRVALASLEGAPTRLLPLAELALKQHASVAIYTNAAPLGLPAEVEILPLDLLPEAPAWADFLALDAGLPGLPGLRARLGLKPFQHLPCPIQVLILTAMPCSGLAGCGVCAVATRDGKSGASRYALACSDGPVFDFNQLEGV